jgi:hypothetical protein
MRRRRASLLVFCAGLAAPALAVDQFTLDGMFDLRWVYSNAETSYLNGGLGPLRFDSDHDDLRVGRIMLAGNLRLNDIVTLHGVVDDYGDYTAGPADISELYLDVRPFPTSAVRWSAKIGTFFMPVSLENREVGWMSPYSITPSALNTWLGEEFRTIGAQIEARWLGASSGYYGDFAFVAAAYGWNDTAGLLIAERGFALSDRPSTLIDNLGRPNINFYYEVDHRPGYYAGVTWRHHDALELRVLRYDNRGNPAATNSDGDGAWRTRFTTTAVRFEPVESFTLLAQYLNGDTAVGADSLGEDQFLETFHAGYVLASLAWQQQRVTARYDDFGTHQDSGFYGPPVNQAGHSWTLAWSYDVADHWQVLAEWIRVTSSFPPRISVGEPVDSTDTQVQAAVRYRFRFER